MHMKGSMIKTITQGHTTYLITQPELAKAFTEWERRYREEPERFMSEASKLLKHTPASYGEACAPYLIKILNEQARKKR